MIGAFDGAASDSLAIFTVTGHGMYASSAHEGGRVFTSIHLSCAHTIFAEQAQINFIYTYAHVYPHAEYVSRLNAAVLGPAAGLDSCLDALLLWGLAPPSPVTVKSRACT